MSKSSVKNFRSVRFVDDSDCIKPRMVVGGLGGAYVTRIVKAKDFRRFKETSVNMGRPTSAPSWKRTGLDRISESLGVSEHYRDGNGSSRTDNLEPAINGDPAKKLIDYSYLLVRQFVRTSLRTGSSSASPPSSFPRGTKLKSAGKTTNGKLNQCALLQTSALLLNPRQLFEQFHRSLPYCNMPAPRKDFPKVKVSVLRLL